MRVREHARTWRYVAVVAGCFALGWAAGYLRPAERINSVFYDYLSTRSQPDWEPQSVIVGIDERTYRERHGVPNRREILVEALDELAPAKPAAVAIDILLADDVDPVKDARLEASLRATPHLVLPCEVVGNGWEDPRQRFQSSAAAAPGHVELVEDRKDGVTRQIPLERIVPGARRWALSLEALSVARGQPIVETPEDIAIGNLVIPAPRALSGRPLYIRYLPAGKIPKISVLDIEQNLDTLRGKTVFIGETALSATRDRLLNPYGESVAGVEAHAQAFETLAHGEFLTPARDGTLLLVCLGLAASAGLIFGLLSGWPAHLLALVPLGVALYLPILFFRYNVVLPFFAPVAVAALCSIGASTWQHFFVRRQLSRSESERSRYQQAIHWAAHEMRTPLTAIQGSSEIMARYNLPDAKRSQLTEMINSESKRLARIIQTFLDVERLAEGQMELKREPFAAAAIVEACMQRAAPLAERKHIAVMLEGQVDGTLLGDRELMEYAFYNLLTNAVKYSPANTQIHVMSQLRDSELRLAVQDQGIGMDSRELKNIFKKFYRTKRAEASGEVGTGIGLSIVEQIITHHGGRVDVSSEPGKGSCFTIVMKAHVT